jgi:hypothetical protein
VPRVDVSFLVGEAWMKASASMNTQACVEVAQCGATLLALRDSKRPDQRPLVSSEIAAMIGAARAGRLDIA